MGASSDVGGGGGGGGEGHGAVQSVSWRGDHQLDLAVLHQLLLNVRLCFSSCLLGGEPQLCLTSALVVIACKAVCTSLVASACMSSTTSPMNPKSETLNIFHPLWPSCFAHCLQRLHGGPSPQQQQQQVSSGAPFLPSANLQTSALSAPAIGIDGAGSRGRGGESAAATAAGADARLVHEVLHWAWQSNQAEEWRAAQIQAVKAWSQMVQVSERGGARHGTR